MAAKFDREILRQRLIDARMSSKLNQAQLAEKAGVTPAAISQIENGLRTPTLPLLQRLTAVLNVSVDYLMGKTEMSEIDDLLQDDNAKVFYRGYQSLDLGDKQTVDQMIEFLKSKKKKSGDAQG